MTPNMIYLIGGPPKTGKTTLAKQLSKQLNIPWVSTDTLQEIVVAYTPEKDWRHKFPYKVIKKRTKGSTDILYGLLSIQEIIQLYRTAAESTFKAIETFINSEMDGKQDYILEGLHIEPSLGVKLLKKHKRAVKICFFVKTDAERFLRDIQKSNTHNDWILKNTTERGTFKKIAEMITTYSQQIEEEAKRNNLKVFNASDNFHESIEKAISFMCDSG